MRSKRIVSLIVSLLLLLNQTLYANAHFDTLDQKKVVSSTLSAKNLNIDTKTLSIQGSKLTAEQATIASEVIELISLKDSDYESHFSDSSGMMTRTIISKGHIKEELVPALIQVRDKLIVNNKDVTNQLQTDNLVKTITSQSGLSVEQIKLVEAYAQSEEWNKKMTSLTGVGGLVVAAIVTVCTMGAGAAVVGAAMEAANAAMATAVQSAIEAAVQAMVSQIATALLTSALTGESPNIDASSLIKSAVLSGVLSYTSNYTQLDNYGFDKGDYTTKIAQAGVNAGTKSLITGGSFKDNLINEAAQTAYTSVGSYALDEYKQSGGSSAWDEGGLNKVLLHSAVGAGVAGLKGEDVLAGAASGAVAELARPLTDGQDKTFQSTVSSLIGGITAGAVGGEGSINLGSYIGQTSDQYNRQLHEKEIQFIKDKAQTFADEKGISLEKAIGILYNAALYENNKASTAWSDARVRESGSPYTLDELSQGIAFLKTQSEGLVFYDAHHTDDTFDTAQPYFTSTDAQYKDNGYNPNNGIGLTDVSVETLLPVVQIGGTVLKTTSPLIGKTASTLFQEADSVYLNAGIKTDGYIQNTVIPSVKEGYYGTMNYVYDPKTVIIGVKTIDILDGYYGGSSPGYNFGSFVSGFENFTGINIVPDWAKP
jgi:filamentous hemagglutinin